MDSLALTINHLRVGETAVLVGIHESHRHKERLLEMGFTPGATLRLVRTAIFGDPIQIQVKNSHFAIRRSDAGLIQIAKKT